MTQAQSALDSPAAHPPPDDPDVLVKVENVGKIFCRDLKRSLYYGFRDGLTDLMPGTEHSRKQDPEGSSILRKGEFWANQGISFQLSRGECLGLIGKNGAGKTTLLKMLNGLIKPDTGRIAISGRVGALIALGAGFNPILTARENVYVNASVLGLPKKEIDKKYDEIVEFSELSDFMETPIQNYSSGMKVRLGFAIASTLTPDVLILDEILAVGDLSFQAKCLMKISELLKSAAVIFVSHNLPMVSRISDKVCWLSDGNIHRYDNTESVIREYEQFSRKTIGRLQLTSSAIKSLSVIKHDDVIHSGQSINFVIEFSTNTPLRFTTSIAMITNESQESAAQVIFHHNISIRSQYRLRYTIEDLCLKPGSYSINLNLFDSNGKHLILKALNLFNFKTLGNSMLSALYNPKGQVTEF